MIGCCEDGVEVDLSCYAGRVIPVPDLLAMKAAGYQAALIWLQGRGIDGSTPPYDLARDTLADHDISWCLDTCRRFCRPDLSMQDGIKGAWRILACQWGAVLRLADALASCGVLAGADGQPYLAADSAQYAAAIGSYRAWRHWTSDRCRRQPGKPAGVWLRESGGHREADDLPGRQLPQTR